MMKDFTITSDNDKIAHTFSVVENKLDNDKSITVKKVDRKVEKGSSLESLSGGCGCLMISFALVFLFAYEAVFNFIIRLISIIKA